MTTKFVTLTSFKGGVGKTTSAICLSCLFAQEGYKVLLIDYDPNRSATVWSSRDQLPFKVATENTANRLMAKEKFDFIVIDTPARPTSEEIKELVDGCDLLLAITTPSALSISALNMMVQSFPPKTKFYVLLTVMPPSSEPDGEIAFHTLKEQGLPVLEQGIQRLKVYEHAAAEGKPVYEIKRGGKKAWEDWKALAKLQPIKELLT
ncbi:MULTISPECIES: ParA family protein [Nostoc]|uniref:ParA family protein n=2 Tax=Nostoc TaxID=1177 RepID=A0ABR8KJM7_9NOSO|nr:MULTISPECIES: ParA family protein [Nostoc]MBD2616527.1 ParA family protein [Nostoc punctiforme FACHB-252]MBD2682946.1 ParA family protein [Nostoc sp. FACHB-857]MBD2739285.1 ParA family protein [Nostoc paludosum FACHB-159]